MLPPDTASMPCRWLFHPPPRGPSGLARGIKAARSRPAIQAVNSDVQQLYRPFHAEVKGSWKIFLRFFQKTQQQPPPDFRWTESHRLSGAPPFNKGGCRRQRRWLGDSFV